MKNPRVEINLNKITHNTKEIVSICSRFNISVAGVTKVFCGDTDVAKAMEKGGIEYIADSRIQNIIGLKEIKLPKLLLRLPMLSEIPELVRYCDLSLNSEVETIKRISLECKKQQKIHKIILMADMGDLREGVWHGDISGTVDKIMGLEGIEIAGIGTNLTCYGGVIPSNKNLGLLSYIAEGLRKRYGLSLPIVSGGNSSSLHLLDSGEMPAGINNLRIGEAIALGRETAFGKRINNTYDDAALFIGEIIEIQHKPSKPIGDIGMDAFGNAPEIEDMGLRYRAIVAAGRQDMDFSGLYPLDRDIKIIGASSDHLIVDITDSKNEYSIGSELGFKMSYGCLLRSMTSPYVNKVKI